MQQIIAKIIVICLLVISVHSATGGEHSPVYDQDVASQTQTIITTISSNDGMPLGGEQMNSECSICHAAHVLLVLAPEGFSFNFYSAREYDGRELGLFTSLAADITHPPIISI